MISPSVGDVRGANVLTSDLWQRANWTQLGAPANTLRTTLPTRAALLYDSQMLYAAFVSDRPMDQQTDPVRDVVTLYLDTTPAGKGAEMIKLSVDATGQASSAWVRISDPPQKAREDGSPSPDVQAFTIPNVKIEGLWTHVEEGTREEEGSSESIPVWVAVVGVPLKNLPAPLQTTVSAGAQWKFNVLRTVMPEGGGERLQSNWSPVYVGAQEFAPYRMAKMLLGR